MIIGRVWNLSEFVRFWGFAECGVLTYEFRVPKRARFSHWTSFRFSVDLWVRIVHVAAAEGRDRNGVIVDALERERYRKSVGASPSLVTPSEASAMRRIARELMEPLKGDLRGVR